MRPEGHDGITEQSVERLLGARKHAPGEEPCPYLELVALAVSGEASDEELASARDHLAACPECAQAVLVLGGLGSRGLLETPGPAGPGRKQPSESPARRSAPALAAAAALLIGIITAVIVWQMTPGEETGLDAGMVVRGETDVLHVAVQRGINRFRLSRGELLQPGDKLGFFYTADSDGFLAVFDLEASGQATLLYPAGETRSGAIRRGAELALPDGGEVTPGSGCEWVVAVFSDFPLQSREIEESLRRSAHQSAGCRLEAVIPGAREVRVLLVRR